MDVDDAVDSESVVSKIKSVPVSGINGGTYYTIGTTLTVTDMVP